ncbi:MAG: enoyl-CoA hydratase/isomerase family protein [Desulfobacterota bacterium]|nr:enoyl-CoA hydratase/isomerase family protein [Thermodesulfobacteriota bacterium]MDW8001086.1 enoyl-CoA hydratase/isomerase family protein [Deltaproteobacteria bacterium]
MNYKFIIYEKKDKVARIVLNAPPSNWLTIEMMKEINDAIIDAKNDPTIQILLFDHAGEKAFCDGVSVEDHTEEKVNEMIEVFHRMFRNLSELDITTVACVNGRALGGGCELMAFCDIVIASEKARIGQPEIGVGVFPPVAAAYFPRIIGLQKTYELLLTGKIISAKEAKEIGLVTTVLPSENFREEVEKYLSDYLNKSRAIAIWVKRAVKASLGLSFLDALKVVELYYLQGLMSTHDAKEGIRAFLEKRKPEWKNA